ncbi:hypothetical protein ISS05_04735 [Candidatus Woesearchaeota archaeon]|nr:hypothetical protein [Candidatus Woesearchaeota archaeon]
MVNQKCLMVRLTRNQHERIRMNAEAKGYKTLSDYIRTLALEHDLDFKEKVDKIYCKVVDENLNTGEIKNNTKLTRFL